jgi:putative membrane protein insertion efficiency factor
MHGVLSIERAQRDPRGADGARGSRQCGNPQPGETAGAGGFPAESRGNPRRLGHCSESPPRGGEGAVSRSGAAVDAPVSGGSSSVGARTAAQGRSALKFLVLAAIGFYRASISPTIPSSCRFYPTCSAYAHEAVSRWGVRRGLWMALRRFARCRPWGGYGYDPVPRD